MKIFFASLIVIFGLSEIEWVMDEILIAED